MPTLQIMAIKKSKLMCIFFKSVYVLVLISISSFCFSQTDKQNNDQSPKISSHDCKIIEQEDHNPKSFTQGFVMDETYFYESSGQYNESFIARYPISTSTLSSKTKKTQAASEIQVKLPNDIFAEGLTLFNNTLYLLSWKKGKAYAINKETLTPIREFNYAGEGWGLTHNGESLIMSDGTHVLRFYNPQTFQLEKTLNIFNQKKVFKNINELEFVDGIIWANQWYSNTLYGIDVHSGQVVATLNCDELRLLEKTKNKESVMNGIAYDAEKKGFWITGKYWQYRFLIAMPMLSN